MPFDPRRFLTAQDRVWSDVTRELAAGQKTSHWMWFVFPQLTELGRSGAARHYGIADLAEAEAYLADPVLRARLVEVAELMLRHKGTAPETILGGVDTLKLRSSMTLFSRVPDAPDVFQQVLDAFYGGDRCPVSDSAA